MKRWIACMLLCALALGAGACFALEEKPLYVALGDSITRGYGLEDPADDCFAAALSRRWGMDLENFAQDGKTSAELLEEIAGGQYDQALARAARVSVCIGANDLLGPLVALVQEAFGGAGTDMDAFELLAALDVLIGKLRDPEVLGAFDAAVEQFHENWGRILAMLREKCGAQTELIVIGLYNPYAGVQIVGFDLGSLCAQYIGQMNAVFSHLQGYTYVDIFALMNEPDMSNASLADASFDPHPSQQGHEAIADKVAQACAAVAAWRAFLRSAARIWWLLPQPPM